MVIKTEEEKTRRMSLFCVNDNKSPKEASMKDRKSPEYLSGVVLAAIMVSMATVVLFLSRGDLVAVTHAAPPENGANWSFTGDLSTPRYSHTATLLNNGKVLVVGGGGYPCNGNICYSTVNGTAELYDPATQTWTSAGNIARRAGHSATLLPDGRVLIAGGANWGWDIGRYEYVKSAQLYDPLTGNWQRTANLKGVRGGNAAVLLPTGKVLVIGATDSDSRTAAYAAVLFDPETEKWSITGAPTISGQLTLLNTGKVLTVSGDLAELYDPATGSWSGTGKLNVIQSPNTQTALGNGQILVTGTASGVLPCAELYDPQTGTWSVTGDPLAIRSIWISRTATLLADGRVLLVGGYDSSTIVKGEELFDPATGSWSFTSRLETPRSVHTATLLRDGDVLVAGGIDGDFDWINKSHRSAELFGLAVVPKIISVSVDGKKLFVHGEGFDRGAVILIDGQEQITKNDDASPRTILVGKRAGRRVEPGVKLQVRNANGLISADFIFSG